MFLLRFDYLQLESIIGNILDKKSKKEKEEKDDERGRSHGRRRSLHLRHQKDELV